MHIVFLLFYFFVIIQTEWVKKWTIFMAVFHSLCHRICKCGDVQHASLYTLAKEL